MEVDKKIVWWGTGNISNILMIEYPSMAPDFFIDTNKEKCNKKYYNKKVLLPEQISEWEKLEVIITTDYFNEILKEYEDVLKLCEVYVYKDFFEKNIKIEDIYEEANRFIINSVNYVQGDKMLFFGDVVSYDKGICSYLNKVNRRYGNLIMYSEADFVSEGYIRGKIDFEFVQMPKLFKKDYVYKGDTKKIITKDIIRYVEKRYYLLKASKNLRLRHKDMATDYEYLVCYMADIFAGQLAKNMPVKVILWNKFFAFHSILDMRFKIEGIPVIYMEFGILPGTFAIETCGQMGESYPAVESRNFNNKEICKKDILEARKIADYICDSNLNRNRQEDISEIEVLNNKLVKEWPVIFYAGQNDFESSLQPYDENTKRFHSPVFKSTEDALLKLSELAKKNNWNLIYKPHPIMTKFSDFNINIPDNVYVVYRCNINRLIDMCDVCVTILSQASYMSVLRKRATVMLGYHQLRGTGVAYEAYDEADIESIIREAVNGGFDEKQESCLYEHIARLVKYYLYDDDTSRGIRYGKSIEELMILINEQTGR